MTRDEELERAGLDHRGDERLRAILDAAVANYRDPDFAVESMAAPAGIRSRQMQALSRRVYGMTPLDIIYRLRVFEARDLLMTRRVGTVREAALAVGAPHIGRSADRYKAVHGVAPSQAVFEARREGLAAERADLRAAPVRTVPEELDRIGIRGMLDPRLRRAVNFIAQHYREPLTITQVAEHAEASAR